MCYWCHTLKHNPTASPHQSVNCRDPKNDFSSAHDEKKVSGCFYCNKIKVNSTGHTSINCIQKENTYSGYYYGSDALPNKYCEFCKQKTHHNWHQSNGEEDPFLVCSKCR